jgi:hypothetical protein
MNEFVAGDSGSKLSVTCTDNALQTAINLTGSSVNLKWENEAGAMVTKAMTIDNAATGVCSYQFAVGELFAPAMTFELEITTASGKIISNLDLIDISVRAKLS